MAINRNKPINEQFIDSFQGILAQDVVEIQGQATLDQLLAQGYIIDKTGTPETNGLYNRLYRPSEGQQPGVRIDTSSTVSNPAPPDSSRFDPPTRNIISVPSAEPVINPDQNFLLPESGDAFYDENGRLQLNYNFNGDKGTTGRGVSPDAPEEFYGIDQTYNSENAPVSGVSDLEGSNTGAPRGLNEPVDSKIKISDSRDATSINTQPFMEDLSKISIDPRPNELNVFGSVSYNISLYMLNSRSYVDITNSPSSPEAALTPPNSLLLMRSGGVGLENSNTAFFNDFFIDDLELTNIATGPSKFKQNTNATDIRFTITEPRGVTLLERLQDAAASVLVSSREKYIHAPYLLRIDFKGYDNEGRPMRPVSRPKFIPIRITNIQFEVTASGTQYKVEAIPFAHFAMGAVVSTIPMNIELKATTVGDIFSSSVIYDEEFSENQTVRIPLDAGSDETAGINRTVKKTRQITAKNLGEVLTDYQKKRSQSFVELQTEKTADSKAQLIPGASELYDTYNFLLSGDIANAKLNISGLYDALNTPVETEDKKEKNSKDKSDQSQFSTYVQGISGGITLDKETSVFKINAGTDVSKLINLIILHSDYMDQNILDNPDPYLSTGDPVKWFKIRPVIQQADGPGKGFDSKDGRYKYFITFAVEKNNVYYSDFPWAKKSKPTGNGVHKVYNYIYSGNNTEVLDFDLKFRNSFLQVMTAGTGSPFANKSPNSLFTPMVKEVPQSVEGNTINERDTVKRARAKDLFSSVMSDGIDMVELNLQVVGDPAFLPTSDSFYHDRVRRGRSYTTAFMPDGTVNYNLSPPYVQVNLRTPTDYDETSGLSNPNKFGNSVFSGVYRVTSVDSTFTGGVFQQKIRGVRTEMQPTANGIFRDVQAGQNTERNAFSLDGLLENRSSNTGSIGNVLFNGITNNVARVLPQVPDTFDEILDSRSVRQIFTSESPEISQQTTQQVFDPGKIIDSGISLAENWLSRFPSDNT